MGVGGWPVWRPWATGHTAVSPSTLGSLSVIQHVYALATQKVSPRALMLALSEAALIRPPFHVAPLTLRDGVLHSPSTALWNSEYECDSVDEAFDMLPKPGGFVATSIDAKFIRLRPELFFPQPAAFAVVHAPRGRRLVIGEPDPDFDEPRPPHFEGRVRTWAWLEGKNAPVLEDFVGSRLDGALRAHWPEAQFLEDAWV